MPYDEGNENLNLPSWVLRAKSDTQEVVAKSRRLLGQPAPDTFLGRAHDQQAENPNSAPNQASDPDSGQASIEAFNGGASI
jgi:hypothetical protein